jgi:hypothetical protein
MIFNALHGIVDGDCQLAKRCLVPAIQLFAVFGGDAGRTSEVLMEN